MPQSLSMMGSLPDSSLFNWPPIGHPAALPPPHAASASVMYPFNIPDNLFSAALDPKVPLTIAAVYAITVKALSRFNLNRGKKAWAISKTRPFFGFVVLHNIFLAVYSAWTFYAMVGVMRRSIVSPFAESGVAGTADSFCRTLGAPGLGNSAYYDDATSQWVSTVGDGAIVDGIPSRDQMGRLWNEGLAYYGWIFYLSKFYEVLDTFIILAKGKPSSTLQTYHHAGAMMCMWAGIRYMSAPIWVFALVNSFIHALMYTYYTLTAFHVKVPVAVKRTLTTMQITQFLLGASYAMLHSFVSYIVPVPRETSAGFAALPSASAVAGAFGSLKQLVFGSAGDTAAPSPSNGASSEMVYTTQPCIPSAGETFAIWLNVLYLAPLTYLFVSFFIASYVKRSNAASKASGKAQRRLSIGNEVHLAEKAGWDAARSVEKEIYNGENMVVNGNGGRSGTSSAAVTDDDVPQQKKKGTTTAAAKKRRN